MFFIFPRLSSKESKSGINQTFFEPPEPYLLVMALLVCIYVCMYVCVLYIHGWCVCGCGGGLGQIHHLLCSSINHSLRILLYDTHTYLRLLLAILSNDLSRRLFQFASILHGGLTDCPSFRRWSRHLTCEFPISLYVFFELSSASLFILDHVSFLSLSLFSCFTWPLRFSFLHTKTVTKIPWEVRLVSRQANAQIDRWMWGRMMIIHDNLWCFWYLWWHTNRWLSSAILIGSTAFAAILTQVRRKWKIWGVV
jgi:hypothetical protein